MRWAVTGDQLTFEVIEAGVVVVGIPNAASFHAHLLAAPLKRTDRRPTDGACGGPPALPRTRYRRSTRPSAGSALTEEELCARTC